MKKSIAILGMLTALAAVPASATSIPIGTNPPANPFFDIKYQTPSQSVVIANFGDTISGANTTFDDTFTFTLPLSGLGSGSVSTSFAGSLSMLTISSVIINGIVLTPAAAALGVTAIPITAGALNTIEVMGKTGPSALSGTYDGTATFESSAVPEPVTWATFLLGFSFIGFALRRKLSGQAQTA